MFVKPFGLATYIDFQFLTNFDSFMSNIFSKYFNSILMLKYFGIELYIIFSIIPLISSISTCYLLYSILNLQCLDPGTWQEFNKYVLIIFAFINTFQHQLMAMTQIWSICFGTGRVLKGNIRFHTDYLSYIVFLPSTIVKGKNNFSNRDCIWENGI